MHNHKDEAQKFQQVGLVDERNYVGHMNCKNLPARRANALKRLNRGSTTVATTLQRESNPYTYK